MVLVTAHRLRLGSDLNFSLVLGSLCILTPCHGAADGLGGMELSQVALLGSQTPLDLMREGVRKDGTHFLGPPEKAAAGEVKMQ